MSDLNLNELVKYYEEFSGKDEVDNIDNYEDMLMKEGFICKEAPEKLISKTVYFYRDDKKDKDDRDDKKDKDNVFVFVYKTCSQEYEVIILPKDYCVNRLNLYTNRPKHIGLDCNGANVYKPRVFIDGSYIYLHRDVMAYFGFLTYENEHMEVDHISHHFGVCIPVEELRTCTREENCRNKPNYRGSIQDEFTYDPLRDYSHSFYIPFLYYVLGKIKKEDMRTLREMELKAELTA